MFKFFCIFRGIIFMALFVLLWTLHAVILEKSWSSCSLDQANCLVYWCEFRKTAYSFP